MSDLSVAEQLYFMTTRIEGLNEQGVPISSGTGFFFSFPGDDQTHIPTIITNKHVVNGMAKLRFFLSTSDKDGNPTYSNPYTQEFEVRSLPIVFHPDKYVDICAIPINPFLSARQTRGDDVFIRFMEPSLIPSGEDIAKLDAIEDIIMIGYPNGLWDSHHNLPIVRKGITATPVAIDYNGKKEFLIDAACFPGSSGSPVMIFNKASYTDKHNNTYFGKDRIYLLGLLYAGPTSSIIGRLIPQPISQSTYQVVPAHQQMLNLGQVIKSQCIMELLEEFKKIGIFTQ